MGGYEVSRLYGVWFFAEGEWFLSFCDATDLAGEGGVGDVVWLIQASASNHKPKEPSLWFVVYGLLEIRHATSLTTGAKHWHRQKAVFYVFCFSRPCIYPQSPNPGIYKKKPERREYLFGSGIYKK